MNMDRTITIANGDKTYYGKIGIITGTTLGIEDHGIMTCYLTVKFDGGGVSVGGHSLDTPFHDNNGEYVGREGSAYGLDLIMWILNTLDVSSWEKIKGTTVIVLFEEESSWGSKAVGIAHPVKTSKVLVFEDHFSGWIKNHPDDLGS